MYLLCLSRPLCSMLLCTEELSKSNSGKLRLYLSKADTAGVEKDRQVSLLQYRQSDALCSL